VSVRVLHVITRLTLGGAAENTLASMAALAGAGYDGPLAVGLAESDRASAEDARRRGVTLVDVSGLGREVGPRDLVALAQLVALVRRLRPAIVHTHTSKAGFVGRLAARLAGVPAVHTLHGLHYERYARSARTAYLALERRLSACSHVVVNVSRAQEAEGLALGLFTPGQSRVIRNGVDVAGLGGRALDRWDSRVALGLDQSALVVGTAARFDEVKRLDLLLRAVAAVPARDFGLVLIGVGSEESRLRKLAGDLGLERRVTFAGEIQGAAALFAAFDVFVTTSRKEGLPLAVLEAMALGLPVVASDIPAHRELLGEGSEGLTAGTVEALAARLSAVLGDGGLRGRLGAENRTRARSEFDARDMLDALEGVYREAARL
jgi:glycosyltransferase involved in cell wall biosynthesis